MAAAVAPTLSAQDKPDWAVRFSTSTCTARDRMANGRTCSCRDGRGTRQRSQAPLIKGKCVARKTLTALKSLASPAIFRKIAWENGAKLLEFRA